MKEKDFIDLYALEKDHWWFTGMRDITAALLGPLLPPKDRDILDAGCGTGGMLTWLARYAGKGKVVGLDISPDAIRFCRINNSNALVQASVTALPFPDASFDVVTSFDVLAQISGKGADAQAIKEMYRVLRPGGIMFVRSAALKWMKSGHDVDLGSQRRYSLKELEEKITSAGFKLLRSTYANTLLLPLAVFKRHILGRIGLLDNGSDVKPLPGGLKWMEKILATALKLEAAYLKYAGRKLGIGLSAIVIAQKPAAEEQASPRK
jgi:ubiquinone/menaquinone biosynthesis C-methylase UbiE